jgi:hypothetical protein
MINVVVHQEKATAGWVIQLAFLFAGSLLTLGGAIALDWIKGWLRTKRVSRELLNELKSNLDRIIAIVLIREKAESDRPLVYAIDTTRDLIGCYDAIKRAKAAVNDLTDARLVHVLLKRASRLGYAYVESRETEYTPNTAAIQEMYATHWDQ